MPRGRHAPPLEVRQDRQRARLFAAASVVFARGGYADATAEAIAREAGMSKATFYEHFGNKEECIVALFDAATETLLRNMRDAAAQHVDADSATRVRTTLGAFLGTLARYPDESQTLLVEIVGAGPRAMERRDRALDAVAVVHRRPQPRRRRAGPSRRGSPPRRTPTRSPARWSSWRRGRSAPACRATSASSSPSSSA